MCTCFRAPYVLPSLSARRAWIEIAVLELIPLTDPVALRKESVDRNINPDVSYNIKETSLSARRAWIEIQTGLMGLNSGLSLSARRAWIEICMHASRLAVNAVALRKESVDRNIVRQQSPWIARVALRKESVDRNHELNLDWILETVALRKESVDRNLPVRVTRSAPFRRSPQGERG